MKMKRVLSSLLCAAAMTGAMAQAALPKETEEQKDKRMEWFDHAKLGIFVHWGIYAVNGVSESWSFHNKYLPYEQYMSRQDKAANIRFALVSYYIYYNVN